MHTKILQTWKNTLLESIMYKSKTPEYAEHSIQGTAKPRIESKNNGRSRKKRKETEHKNTKLYDSFAHVILNNLAGATTPVTATSSLSFY